MSMLKRIVFAGFLAVAMFSLTFAQDSVNSVAQRSSVTQSSANSFQVFINNGTGALVDNDFVFIATAR